MDVQLKPNDSIELTFGKKNPAVVCVYRGYTDSVNKRQLGIYSTGETLVLKAGAEGADLLVLSSQPINEPLVQYDPFVMNKNEEIEQALQDFRNPQYLRQLKSAS